MLGDGLMVQRAVNDSVANCLCAYKSTRGTQRSEISVDQSRHEQSASLYFLILGVQLFII